MLVSMLGRVVGCLRAETCGRWRKCGEPPVSLADLDSLGQVPARVHRQAGYPPFVTRFLADVASSRRWIGVLLATGALVLVFAASVGAQSQPPDWYEENAYTFDPHGLISLLPWVSVYGSGVDTFEVWVCWTPGDSVANIHDPERLTSWLNHESDVVAYFRWLSGNRYRPAFRAGGEVNSNYSLQSLRWGDCVDRVKAASPGGADGALIIDTSSSEEGWAGPGEWCRAEDCATFPDNDRWAIVGGDAFADTYVHEIGHALHWPHSYSWGSSWEYDNPMDVMGSPTNDGKREWKATPAVNRYAAGWIDPDDMAVWVSAKGVTKFRLDPIGVSTGGAKQMVALTYTDDGVFDMLGARVRGGYDLDIPKEGVEVYRVDQRTDACDNDLACVSLNRRVWQQGSADAAEHVLGPGESLSIPIIYADGSSGARVVTVKRRVGDSFDVVIGPPFAGTFRDDDDSVHEVNIEALAQESITAGCDADLDLFCPHRSVTRAQLAVLLVRATEGDKSLPAASGNVYTDVPADAWHARHAERFALKAWTNPEGVFRPNDPATRADVAEFITRLLPTVPIPSTATGRFSDVPAGHPNILAIEALAVADVTKGCDTDPPRFCPDSRVTRAQAATFLVRALGAADNGSDASTGIAIATGSTHSCAIRQDATVVCWGNNFYGQSDASAGRFTAVTAGEFHSCGIRTDGTVLCWGDNEYGQSDAPSVLFTAIGTAGGRTFGGRHSCGIRGIRTDGTLTCWGDNSSGQLDAPAGRFTAVAAGGFHSCGIRTDETLICWGGGNHSGQLDAPAGRFTAASAGSSHTCGIRTDETLICWGGSNHSGQLDAPAGRFTAASAGSSHTCGIRTDETLICWGSNNFGQSNAPAGRFTAVSAGDLHSCGIRTDGRVVCWGDNIYGQSDAPSGRFTSVTAAGSGSAEAAGLPPDIPMVWVESTNDSLVIGWSADDNGTPIDRWLVEVHELSDGGGAFSQGSLVGGMEFHSNITRYEWNLSPGEYVVYVRAHNVVGGSEWGESQHVRVGNPPAEPVVDTYVRRSKVEASWSADDNGLPVDAWHAQLSRVGSDELLVDREYAAYRMSTEWFGVGSGDYVVRVRAKNAAGWSEWGVSEEITVGEREPPGWPGIQLATTTNGYGSYGIKASWSADDNGWPIDLWEYSVLLSDGEWSIVESGTFSGSTTGYQWPLSPGGYLVRVRAHNAGGWSEWGESQQVTVGEPPPAPNLQASARGNSIEASWSVDDNSRPIDRWRVLLFKIDEDDKYEQVGTTTEVGVSTTNWVWSDMAPGHYMVAVRAHTAGGWGGARMVYITVGEPPATAVVTMDAQTNPYLTKLVHR